MAKNKFKFLFIILLILINIFAFKTNAYAFDVKVTDIRIVEQSGSITLDEPVINKDNEVQANITFNDLNDFVTYEIELENNDDYIYVVESILDNNTNKNIDITYETETKDVLNNDKYRFRVKFSYNNYLINVKNLKLDDITMKINLVRDDGRKQVLAINNPKTGDNSYKYFLLIGLIIIGLIVKKKNRKIGLGLLLLSIIIFPFITFAFERYEIDIDFKNIEINGLLLPYEVTYDFDNGELPQTIVRKYGDKLGELPIPEKKGYEFIGWYNGEDEVDENFEVKKETNLKAKYTIILYSIEYNLDGGKAVNPNIYTVEDEITLNNPTKMGYTFSGWTGSNGPIPELDVVIEKGSIGSKEFTANYAPNTDTPYKVNHSLMDLDGKNYTLKDTEDFTGITDTEVTPLVKKYKGFKSPEEVTVNIDGDGSTAVDYLYERKKYTLTIENEKYVDTETPSGKYYYETEITLKAENRKGYTFVGWSNGEEDKTITFNLLSDLTIKPVYTAKNDTAYKVIHKQMNLDGVGYTEKDTELFTGTTDTLVTPEVKTYNGFTSPEVQTVNIDGDGSTVVEYLYTRNKYNLVLQDKEFIKEGSTAEGEYFYNTEIHLVAVDRPGYTFISWSNNERNSDYSFKIKTDTILGPVYEANKNTPYKVVHKLMDLDGIGYTEVLTQTFTGTTDTLVTPSVKTYEGFTSPEVQTVNIDGDGSRVVEYLYTRNKYTLTVVDRTYIDESISTDNGEYYYGSEISLKANPKTGYNFNWSDGDTSYEKNFILEKNTTLQLIYTPRDDIPYKVIHKLMNSDGETYYVKDENNYVGTADAKTIPPVNIYEGFTSPEGQEVVIKPDGSLVVEYFYTRNKYTFNIEDIKFVDTENSTEVGVYFYGTEVHAIANDRIGYTYKGWSNGETNKETVFNLLTDTSIRPLYDPNPDTPYKVIHKQMNMDGETYTVVDTEDLKGTTDREIIPEVKTYEGFTSPKPQKVTISPDGSLVVEYYYTRNKYKLTLLDKEYINILSTPEGEYFYGTEIHLESVDRFGYEYIGWSDGESNDVEYNFILKSDKTLGPVYSANTDTPYKVVHKQMTLDGKDYTEVLTELFTGTTDSEVTPEVYTYYGFTSPTKQKLKIKGNGKSVLNYLYERNKYKLTLNNTDYIDFTKSTEAGKYYYQTELSVVAKDRPHYTYKGWNNGVLTKENKFNIIEDITLEPLYTPNPYIVTFNKTSGTGEMNNQTLIYDKKEKLSKNLFTKVGYTFASWNTKADGSGESYLDEEEVKNITEEDIITLYAQFTPNPDTPYKVIHKTMNLDRVNYTVKDTEEFTGTSDSTVTPAVKTYYGFTSPSTSALSISPDGSGELVYLYSRDHFTITYNSNGGSSVSSESKQYEESLGTLPVPTKTGYAFSGWFTASEGGSQVSSSTTVTKDVTYYAHWTASKVTVTFNKNGGSGTDNQTQTFTYGVSNQSFSNKNLSRTGYTISGWSETSNATTAQYSTLSSVADSWIAGKCGTNATCSVTLYAVWKANTFTVAYNGNGNTGGSTASHTCTYNQNCYLSGNGFTKTGYTFAGWKKSNSGSTLAAGANITNAATSGTVTYYAQWTANTYTVSYSGNGSTGGSVTNNTCTYNSNCSIKGNSYTRNGYTFAGWSTNSNNTDDKYGWTGWSGKWTYVNGQYGIANNKLQLYARWTANTFTVAYNGNGATGGSTTSHICTYGSGCSLKTNGFTRPGYYFTGWKKSNSGSTLRAGSSIANAATSGTVTYYAQWAANTYTVSFNANGGSVSPASKSVTYNSTYGSLPTPSRSGYIFIGWYTQSTFDSNYYANTYGDLKNAFGYDYQSLLNHWVNYGINEGRYSSAYNINANSKYTSTSNITLYAQWKRYGASSACGCASYAYNTCTSSECCGTESYTYTGTCTGVGWTAQKCSNYNQISWSCPSGSNCVCKYYCNKTGYRAATCSNSCCGTSSTCSAYNTCYFD